MATKLYREAVGQLQIRKEQSMTRDRKELAEQRRKRILAGTDRTMIWADCEGCGRIRWLHRSRDKQIKAFEQFCPDCLGLPPIDREPPDDT